MAKRRTGRWLAREQRRVNKLLLLVKLIPAVQRYGVRWNTTVRFYNKVLPIVAKEEEALVDAAARADELAAGPYGDDEEVLELAVRLEEELRQMRGFRDLLHEYTVLRFGTTVEKALKLLLAVGHEWHGKPREGKGRWPRDLGVVRRKFKEVGIDLAVLPEYQDFQELWEAYNDSKHNPDSSAPTQEQVERWAAAGRDFLAGVVETCKAIWKAPPQRGAGAHQP